MPKKGSKGSEITINKEIQSYAEQLIPIAYQLQFFYDKQSELFDKFSTYTGGAKKEINEYSAAQLEQLDMMIKGYNILANNLIELVQVFIEADEDRARQFNLTLKIKTGNTVTSHFADKENASQSSTNQRNTGRQEM